MLRYLYLGWTGVYEDAFSSVDNKYGMNKFDYLEFYDWDESNTESEMVLTVSDQNLSEFEDLPYDELFVVELTNFLRSINERTPSTQTNYMIKKYSENIALNIEDLILFRHNLGIEAQCELISFANDENGVFYHETPINNKSNSFADYPDIKLENEGSISLYLICWSEDNTVDISTIDLMSELILMKNKKGAIIMARDYRNLLANLKELAQEHRDLGEVSKHAELLAQIEKLEAWIEAGMNGEAPFDLDQYDIDLEAHQISEDEVIVSNDEGDIDEDEIPVKENDIEDDIDFPLLVKELNESLDKAIEYYGEKKFKESLTLSKLVVERSKGKSDEIFQKAENLADNSRREIAQEIDKILARANELFEQGEIEQAEEEYKKARDLNPDNKRVIEFGRKTEKEYQSKFDQTKWNRLRAQLRDSMNLESLQDAIYQAKALDVEGLLDDELQGMLVAAETKYKEIAVAHGEETTMMRFNDLSQRAEAVKRLRNRFITEEKKILDATTGTMREPGEVLREAEQLYQQASERTVSHDIEVIDNKLLPCHPKVSLERLKKYETLELETHYKDLVENKRAEVEQALERKEKAEVLYKQAQKVRVSWEKYNLYLQVKAIHPLFKCQNMDGDFERAQELALSHLNAKIEDEIEKQTYFYESDQVEAIEKSLAYFNEIDKLYNNWPEKESPEAFEQLKSRQADIFKKLQARLKLIREFENLADQIREKVMDPNQRHAGLELYKELMENPEYESLSQRDLLSKEIDVYKDVGLRMLEIRKAEASKNWELLSNLSEKLLNEGKAEKFGDEVDALFKKATFELNVQKVKTLVARDEIIQAAELLSKLLADEKLSLGERLSEERKILDQCRENKHQFKPIFQEAERLAKSKSVKDKVLSLAYFDFLAGKKVEINGATFPQYELNYYKAQANEKGLSLLKDIKSHEIALIRKVDKSSHSSRFSTLQKRVDEIYLLRGAGIELADEDYEVCKRIEKKYALAFEENGRELNQWEEIYQVWDRLDKVYFNDFDIEKHKQNALIQLEIDKSEKIRIEKGPQEAIDYLQNKLSDPRIKTSGGILLAMADIALNSKDFRLARQFLDEARRYSSVSEKCNTFEIKLKRESVTYEGIQKADQHIKSGQIFNAFQTLNAVKNKLDADSRIDISDHILSLYTDVESDICSKSQ